MIKKLLFLTFLLFQFSFIFAQVNVLVEYTDTPPVIDGEIDKVWDNATVVPIEKDFQEELPTVEATWRAMWDDNYIYVLIEVYDDDHYPSWESGGTWYEYDQTEVYFDINPVLKDGRGPNSQGTGHYLVLGRFGEELEEVETALDSNIYFADGLHGSYVYILYGDDYVFEYAVQISSLMNIDSNMADAAYLQSLDSIGFDITIIDQDEGETESRQRAVWSNQGNTQENYYNMDDAGTITLVDELVAVDKTEQNTFSVYPNPANDFITVEENFDAVAVFNGCGQKMSNVRVSDKQIDISALPEGLYMMKIYKGDEIIGTSKFVKK